MHRKPLREVGNGRLRTRISRNTRQRTERIHRRNVDNAGFGTLSHILGKHLRRNERSQKVEIEYKRNAVRIKIKKGLYAGHVHLVFKIRFFKIILGGRAFGIVAAGTVNQNIAGAEIGKDIAAGGDNTDTGVEGVAAVVGVIAVAGAVVVISRKTA